MPTALVVVCAGGIHITLLLLPVLQKWQLNFFVFCILLSIICPNCACTQLFSVPYSFFAFCCLRRCLSRCKHCSAAAEGSRSWPVSAASSTFLDSTLDLVISPALVPGIKIWVPYLFIVSGVSLPLGPFSRCS